MAHKYSIGSGVYLVFKGSNRYEVYPTMLEVDRLSVDEEGNHYSLRNEHGDAIDWCREENIFRDKKEAEIECKARNSQ